MSLVEQLMVIETRMDAAFLNDRFQTFNQLASDRLRLLQHAQKSPEKDQVFELARHQTSRWVTRLENQVHRQRQVQQRKKSIRGAYGRATQGQSGSFLQSNF
jgi:hypothetical protein